jgi:hypothetical protein
MKFTMERMWSDHMSILEQERTTITNSRAIAQIFDLVSHHNCHVMFHNSRHRPKLLLRYANLNQKPHHCEFVAAIAATNHGQEGGESEKKSVKPPHAPAAASSSDNQRMHHANR